MIKNNRIIEVKWNGEKVGRLSLTPQRTCAFQYTKEFIANGVSISPFELPLQPRVFIASQSPFEGGFGVFDDSLPDGWGLLILDRFLRKKGINPHTLNLLDRLALVGTSGRGALEYHPDESIFNDNDFEDFRRMASEAAEILKSEKYAGKGIDELYLRGGSPGGARPKIFIRHENKEWLVKFHALTDPKDIGKTEYEYSLIAQQCGVQMPQTRLFDNKYFGVQRFDRKPNGEKIHTVSISGLLRADYRIPSIDYSHIFKVVQFLSKDFSQIVKIYRLMIFNYLIGNLDDHAKNFSMVFQDGKWQLSPAYDILPGGGINGFRTTSINDKIEPSPDDIFKIGIDFGLSKTMAKGIFEEMKTVVGEMKQV